MAVANPKPSAPKPVAKTKADEDLDPVERILADNPEIADEMEPLTRGEKLIRLRQKGLVGFEIQ